MTRTAAPHTATWVSLHCHLCWATGDVDALLLDTVRPALTALRDTGRISDWFYIRYAENGPHLRLRLRDPEPGVAAGLTNLLRRAVQAGPPPMQPDRSDWIAHGEVRPAPYEPETRRYGGPAALPVAERVFCRSSELALAALDARRGAGRLALATDLALVTARAVGLSAKDTARWLRTNAFTWRWHDRGEMVMAATGHNAALAAAARQHATLTARWAALGELVASGGGTGVLAGWAEAVTAARLDVGDDGSEVSWLGVWASQLHMLNNRLGLLPDEERTMAWFAAAGLLGEDEPEPYFTDEVIASDRRYLAASRYREATMPEQQPREATGPAPLVAANPFAGPPTELPTGPLPPVPLGECLAARRSARGRLGGPLTAAELGTLLWTAHAPVRPEECIRWGPGGAAEFRRRPYPSAGAQFTARLRVVVRDVAALASGTYEADPLARALVPQSGPPSDAELVAASMWLVDSPEPQDRIDVSTLPALLGVYVSVGRLRARYGLRALRFALLEAGHLAQNIALVATALGLTVGTIGGFYDDVANELFLLDGVDDVLVYLMPLGRSATHPD